jgi:hypothetical protein
MSSVLIVLLAACLQAHAGPREDMVRTGRVYADHDGNLRQGPGEPGLAGVAVSNGRAVVHSDADGDYRIPVAPGDIAFVVKPAGWEVPVDGDGSPRFWWREPSPSPSPAEGVSAVGMRPDRDFALRPTRLPEQRRGQPLQVLIFADPQVKSMRDVSFYARDIVDPLRHAPRADLGLTLGDVVDDVLSLYPAINAVTTRLGVPWLHAPGNHDVDAGAASDGDSLETYRRVFGPDTYAWEEAGASFVVLDDVITLPGQRPAYVGGLREDQFDFLAAYLPRVPRDRLLVLALHIPLFDTAADGAPETFRSADRARLFALLRDFPHVLVLSGHRHGQRHDFHGAADGWHGALPLHEYSVGAASGAYWSGIEDAQGIPDATMADGTPNGHARLEIGSKGAYRLSWHPARQPSHDPAFTGAMALHAPKVLRQGAYPGSGVYANVFMGHAATRVEYRVDTGDWRPMTRVEQPDPRLLVENVRDDLADTLRGYDRSPEAEPSQHLWRGNLPTDLAAGVHEVEVRAFDDWQGEQRARIRYRLAPALPRSTAAAEGGGSG